MKTKRSLLLNTTLCLFLTSVAANCAVTLVSDNFDTLANGGARDSSGKYSTGATASTWWYENTSSLAASAVSTPTPTGNFSGNFVQTNFSGPSNMGVVSFASTTLGVGDNLSVQFDFRNLSAPVSLDRNPQFGLYNGVNPTSDMTGTSAVSAGYSINFADAATDTATMTSDTSFFTGTSVGSTTLPTNPVSGAYTVNFRLAMARTSASTLIFNLYLDGVLITTFTDTAATNFTFDEFALRARTTAQIDNLVIATSVPEPGSYAMVAMGVAMLLFLGSRKRSLQSS